MRKFIIFFAILLSTCPVWCQVSADSDIVWKIDSTHGLSIQRMVVSPDGNYFTTINGLDGKVYTYNTSDGSFISAFQAHKQSGTGIGFSSDGQYLATCSSRDTQIKVWKTSDWSLYKSFDAGMDANPNYVCFSHNDKFIAACANYVGYKIWGFETGKTIKIIDTYITDIHNTPTPTTIEFSPNDSLLALSATQNAGRVYDLFNDSTILYSIEESRFALFSRDGKKFIADYETKEGNGVCIYDIKSKDLLYKSQLSLGIIDADISYDNKYLAYCTGNSTDSINLQFFDLNQNKITLNTPFPYSYIKFIPNTHYLLLGAYKTIIKLDIDKITDVNNQIDNEHTENIHVFPNPGSSIVTIKYQISKPQIIKMIIEDLNGNIVTTLFEGYSDFGSHDLICDTNPLSSGSYFVKLILNNSFEVQKFLINK